MAIEVKEWELVRLRSTTLRTYDNALNAWQKSGGWNETFTGNWYIYNAFDFPNGSQGTYGGYMYHGVQSLPLDKIKSVTLSNKNTNSSSATLRHVNISDLIFTTASDFSFSVPSSFSLDSITGSITFSANSNNPSGYKYSYTLKYGSTTLSSGNFTSSVSIKISDVNYRLATLVTSSTTAKVSLAITTTGTGVNSTKTYSITANFGYYGAPSIIGTPTITATGAVGNTFYLGISSLNFNHSGYSGGAGVTITSARLTIGSGTNGWNLTNASGTYKYSMSNDLTLLNKTMFFYMTIENSRKQKATKRIDTAYTLKRYEGVSISSFEIVSRTASTVKFKATGSYNSGISSKIGYSASINTSAGVNKKTVTGDVVVTPATGKWTLEYEFTSIESDANYELSLSVTDSLGISVSTSTKIGGEEVAFSLGKFGAGVGVVVDDEGAMLQVGAKGIYSLGDIETSGSVITGKTLTIDTRSSKDKDNIALHGNSDNINESSRIGFYDKGALAGSIYGRTQTGISVSVGGSLFSIGSTGVSLGGNSIIPTTVVNGTWYTRIDYPTIGVRVMLSRHQITSSIPDQRFGSWRFTLPVAYTEIKGINANLSLTQTSRPSFDLTTQVHNVTNSQFSFEAVSLAVATTNLKNIMLDGHFISVMTWGLI